MVCCFSSLDSFVSFVVITVSNSSLQVYTDGWASTHALPWRRMRMLSRDLRRSSGRRDVQEPVSASVTVAVYADSSSSSWSPSPLSCRPGGWAMMKVGVETADAHEMRAQSCLDDEKMHWPDWSTLRSQEPDAELDEHEKSWKHESCRMVVEALRQAYSRPYWLSKEDTHVFTASMDACGRRQGASEQQARKRCSNRGDDGHTPDGLASAR